MHDQKIKEYLVQAAACVAHTELEPNKSIASRWIKVAQECTRMAGDLEPRLNL